MGIKQLLFICTFRISNWFVTGIKFWSHWVGKIVFTPYRILSCTSFSNLGDQNILRWDKVGIKQLLFICTFRMSNWFVTGIKFWSDRDGKIVFTPYRILSCISFFKPRRPEHSQMGQRWQQTTPLHLYIQNIKLVCDWNQGLVTLGWENRVYTLPNIKLY